MSVRRRLAWFLRGIAKRINAVAERVEPVKVSLPVVEKRRG